MLKHSKGRICWAVCLLAWLPPCSFDGTRTFEWDAANQLVAITAGTRRTELSYDGMQQAVRIVEKDGKSTQSDTQSDLGGLSRIRGTHIGWHCYTAHI